MKHYRLFLTALAAVFSLGLSAQSWTGNEVANGKFFLYNVGTGTYLCGANDWGTHSSVSKWGIDYTLEGSDGVYTLESQIANNSTDHYLGGNYTDAGAKDWTFTKVSNSPIAYTLNNGEGYLAHTSGTYVEVVADGSSDDAKWILVSYDDIYAAMEDATESSPVDVRLLIPGADIGRNNQRNNKWEFTHTGGNNRIGGDNKNFIVEAWNSTFEFSQTLTNLPVGYYKFSCSGFGTNGTTYIFAGEVETPFAVTTNNSGDWAVEGMNVEAGEYTGNEIADKVLVTDGTLKVGIKRTEQVGADWALFDKFILTYYGAPTDLSAYEEGLAAVVAEAEALEGTIPGSAYSALAAVVSANNKSYSTADAYTEATKAIKDAIEEAKVLQGAYSRYVLVRDAVKDVSSSVSTSSADAIADDATTSEDIEDAVVAVRQALVDYLPNITVAEGDSIDLTNALLDNPTVSKNTDYWTKEGTPNGGYSWAAVNYGETEFYQQNFKFYQKVILGKGTYSFGVTGFHRAGNHSTYFYAGDDKILIPGVESSVVNNMAAAKEYFDDGNGMLYLKFVLENDENEIEVGIENKDTQTDKWTIFRNFTLRYYGSKIDLSSYEEAWEEAVAAANAALADDAYANVTGDELSAVNTAKADEPDYTKESFTEKIGALNDAVQAFKAAAAAYDAYAAEKAVAEMIGSEVGDAPTTAAEATAAVAALKEGEFDYIEANYKFDKTSEIGDFPTWEYTATVNNNEDDYGTNENEHWSGNPKTYYEQPNAGWGASLWTLQFDKEVKLPAGDYMLKVAARASAGVTAKMFCDAATGTTKLTSKGATGKGIDKAGDANFGDGEFAREDGSGYGWEWCYLPFSLSEEKTVAITLEAETNSNHQWVSWCDISLLCKQDVATGITNVGSENVFGAKDIYNLQGQKVGKTHKGVFIMNGKKIVVK